MNEYSVRVYNDIQKMNEVRESSADEVLHNELMATDSEYKANHIELERLDAELKRLDDELEVLKGITVVVTLMCLFILGVVLTTLRV